MDWLLKWYEQFWVNFVRLSLYCPALPADTRHSDGCAAANRGASGDGLRPAGADTPGSCVTATTVWQPTSLHVTPGLFLWPICAVWFIISPSAFPATYLNCMFLSTVSCAASPWFMLVLSWLSLFVWDAFIHCGSFLALKASVEGLTSPVGSMSHVDVFCWWTCWDSTLNSMNPLILLAVTPHHVFHTVFFFFLQFAMYFFLGIFLYDKKHLDFSLKNTRVHMLMQMILMVASCLILRFM